MRVAAIDIGTNSVLLLVAERDPQGNLLPILERVTTTRLGQGVDERHRLAPEAIERTLRCLEDYAGELQALGVTRVDAVGTSAMRDASGGEGFLSRAQDILSIAPRVISGEEEAELTFIGALGGLDIEGPVTIFDVGGGSTEIVRGFVARDREPEVRSLSSLDLGSVRLFERFIENDPPSPDEIRTIEQLAADELRGHEAPLSDEPLVGIAGTMTTLAAVARSISPYDGSLVHGMQLSESEISATARRMAGLPLAERRLLPGLEPQRADIIIAGTAIISAVLAWSKAERVLVSDRGLRWGLAEKLAPVPEKAHQNPHSSPTGARTKN